MLTRAFGTQNALFLAPFAALRVLRVSICFARFLWTPEVDPNTPAIRTKTFTDLVERKDGRPLERLSGSPIV